MLSLFLDGPFPDTPPDKASVRQRPQQIDEQHFAFDGFNPENHEFDSDVDSRLLGRHLEYDTLVFLSSWMPQCCGMSTNSAACPTPSLFSGYSDSDHSTVGPLSPSSDFGPWSAEADEHKDEELFCTASGSPGEVFQGPEVAFGTQATFAHGPSFPFPSSRVSSGYGPPPRQHMDSAAAADVRRPPPSYGYPGAGAFPSMGAANFTNETRREEDVSPTNPSAPWSYADNMDNGGGTFSVGADTINPSLLSNIPITPGYCCPQASFTGQEQLQEHHYGVAPADALGLGSDTQMPQYPDEAETTPSLSGPYPNLDAARKHIHGARKGAPSKKLATSTGKKKRTQSTEKVFPCLWTGCLKAFARTNNLKVHEKGVHYKIRDHVCPVAGCPKAEANKGFSRKFDLDNHMLKHHPAECGDAPAA